MVYNSKHKILLQTIIQEGALDGDNGKELVIKLFDHDNTALIINEINAKLQPLNMTIKYINCELTGQLYWVLTNTVLDITNRFPLEFSQAELTLLRNIYSEIVTSSNGYVSSTFCLNLCSTLNLKLTKACAEEFLHNIVTQKWLSCKDGQYYMGVRSSAELLQYFKNTYEDNICTCALCKQVLFYGEKCDQCKNTMHIHCLRNYTADQNGSRCPNCHSSTLESDNLGSCSNINSNGKIDESTLYTKKRKVKRSR